MQNLRNMSPEFVFGNESTGQAPGKQNPVEAGSGAPEDIRHQKKLEIYELECTKLQIIIH